AHPAADLGGVLLDLHPPSAAEAVLAASEIAGEEIEVHAQAGGHAGEDGGETGAVALAAGGQVQPAHGGSGYQERLIVRVRRRLRSAFHGLETKEQLEALIGSCELVLRHETEHAMDPPLVDGPQVVDE